MPALSHSPLSMLSKNSTGFRITLLTAAIVFVMLYSSFMMRSVTECYTPLINTVQKIKFEIAMTHLQFEEHVSGDRSVTLEAVWNHLARAEKYAGNILNNEYGPKFKIISLKNTSTLKELEQLIEKITFFKKRLLARKQNYSALPAAQTGNIAFHSTFDKFLSYTDSIETSLEKELSGKILVLKYVQYFLMAAIIIFGACMAAALRQKERQHQNSLVSLKEKEEHLRTTINSIGDGVIVTDTEGNITRMNPVAERLTGWAFSQAAGKPLTEIFRIKNTRTGKDASNPVFKVLQTGKIEGLANHTMLLAKDGTRYQISDSAAPIYTMKKEISGVVLVFRDVTEEYGIRKALVKNEQYLQSIFRSAPTGIGVVIDRIIQKVNEKICAMTGYTREELIGQSALILYPHKEDFDYVGRTKYKMLRKYGTGTVETRWKRKDGKIIDVLLSSTPIDSDNFSKGITFTALDITDRKQTESLLHLSLEKYEKTFQAAPVWVVLSSLETGRYIEVNDTFLKTMGYSSPEEVIGRTSQEIGTWVNPDDRRKIVEKIRKTGQVKNIEVQRKTRSGAIIDTLFSAESLHLNLRSEQVIISVSQDITKQKQSEKEKARLEEQFHQIQKLESIGRLAGGVAHDLNNLLSPIIGYGEILLEEKDLGERRQDSVKEIVNAGMRAKDLVHQLLAFSRKQTLEYRQLNLAEAVLGVEKLIRRTIRENIRIEIVFAPGHFPVMADLGQIEQMIMNLAVNGADAMVDGGTLTIEISTTVLDREYARLHQGVTPGPHVMLAVSDTGCGMDSETCSHIFEPFFSTKGEEGTGLGLATVYGIVKQHKGNIWVYSEPGRGTTFKVYLPLCREEKTFQGPEQKRPGDLTGTEIILLVEDNEQVRNLTLSILKRKGYSVLVAKNGQDALVVLKAYKGPLHLLLTDVVMPEMNGKELFNRLRDDFPGLKVIYMSGYTDNVIAHHGILDKNTPFIQKPFTIRDLAAKVREVFDNR
ncbi:PAS domain S-box protein [Desulfomarina sp.]